MDTVSLPISDAAPWVIAAVACIGLLVVFFRQRRPGNYVNDAVLEAVYVMSQATPNLRQGLEQGNADEITTRLLDLLKCVAVGITDRDGRLLSWDGEANYHYVDLEDAIDAAITMHRREVVSHENIPCDYRGTCRMRTAVIVPVVVDDRIESALIIVGRSKGKTLIQMAEAVARFVCTQFELAKLQESKSQLQQAEIRALRAQISPHFVYNALNTISSLIRTDPEEARELLQEFADFTRYSFRTSGMFTSLSEELRNVDRYLTIESARYRGRLQVRLKIAPEVLPVVVPFLIIQPLVENAVKHGLANKPSGGTVTVTAQDHGTEAVISVEDDGIGMDASRLEELYDSHRTGAHVGISNINQRMQSLFGIDYPLIVETAPGAGMKVTLRIPKYIRGIRPDLAQLPQVLKQEIEAPPDSVSGQLLER